MSGYVLPMLKAWLRRSGTAGMRISIKCIKIAPFPDGFGVKLTSLILGELASQAERIKNLLLILPENDPESSIEVTRGLKKLNLHNFTTGAERIMALLEDLPELEKFSFRPPYPLPWGSAVPTSGPNTSATSFVCLHTLELFITPLNTGGLLDWLCLPQLKKLVLTFNEPWPFMFPRTWPYLERLLRRSRPPLESLTLISDWMTNEEVIRCLELLPSLRELSIRFTEDIADALRFPAPDEESTQRRLCPVLKLIEFNDVTPDVSNEEFSSKVQDMVASRGSAQTVKFSVANR